VRFVVGGPLHGNVHLRLAQFRAATEPARAAALARWFSAGKLQNYRRLLQRWAADVGAPERMMLQSEQETIELRLQALAGTEDGDRIRGIEGDGTRRYLKGLTARLASEGTALSFGARTRRPPRDPVNSLLSFLYGLVTAELSGAVEAVGLDLQVGFLHGFRPGRPALALDLLEELRPAVADRFALRLIGRRQVRTEHFVFTVGGPATYGRGKARRSQGLRGLQGGRCTPPPPWPEHPTLDATKCAGHPFGPSPQRGSAHLSAVRDRGLMDVLVTYDINTTTREGEVRLARVAQVCERYGVRVQYSVFECRLSDASLLKLHIELEGVIEPALDSVHLYRFPGALRDARTLIGRPRQRELGEPWIV
jgi:CRISPR-associated endonuclease Cas2